MTISKKDDTYYVEGKLYNQENLLKDIKRGVVKLSTDNPNSTIYIDGTSYNIEKHWLEIAKKYFNVEQNDLNAISYLKSGFFGYFNEIASNEVKNATYHRNVLYDEHFLNTASFPKSILNFARLNNIPLLTAKPSKMLINFAVKKSDLLNSSMKQELTIENTIGNTILKNYEIIIDKKYDFTIKNYIFRLPYDVQILISETTSDEKVITARYQVDNNFPFLEVNTPYIDVWQDSYNGEKYVFFKLDVFQMECEDYIFDVSSTDTINKLFYTIEFSNQLAYFEVYYIYNDKTIKLNTYFNNTFTPRNDEYFCYYTFIDDNKLQISFSNLPNTFRPGINSKIIIKAYSTKGSAGNISYLGDITYNFSNSTEEAFESLPVKVANVSEAEGGTDQLSNTEMKQLIIEQTQTRDNLITDNDLEIYFNNLNITQSINKSQIKFMKRRDDLLKRVYSAFLLLRDSNQKVMPTNTIPKIFFPNSFFKQEDLENEDELFIPEYTVFMYKPDIKSFIPIKDFRASDYFEDANGKILSSPSPEDKRTFYRIPYLLKLETSPILMTNYYNLFINKIFNLSYTYINNLITNVFSINSIKIKKEIELEKDRYSSSNTTVVDENLKDTYRISFNLNNSLTSTEEINKILVRAIFYSSTTNIKYGYIDFKRSEDSESEYYANLVTNRNFYKNNLVIYDSLYNESGEKAGSEDGGEPEVPIEEEIYIKFAILYKDSTIRNYNEDGEDSRNSDEVKDFLALAPKITDPNTSTSYHSYNINEYAVASIMKTLDNVKLFRNLGQMLNSIVTKGNSLKYDKYGNPLDINGNIVTDIKRQSSESGFFIEMLPVVGFDYFQLKYSDVYNLIEKYMEIIDTVMPRLENNTNVDIKFYNTFGPSNYYYLSKNIDESSNTINNIINYEYISKIDILLDMTIYLFEIITTEKDNEIKQFISDFIEECNINGVVPISNLLRLLETNFDIIKYIEYDGLSGDYSNELINKYQVINNKFTSFLDMSKEEIISYVPEYINLKKDATRNTMIDSSGKTIDLGISYDYVINITYKNPN